jgi:hypothetical protein
MKIQAQVKYSKPELMYSLPAYVHKGNILIKRFFPRVFVKAIYS